MALRREPGPAALEGEGAEAATTHIGGLLLANTAGKRQLEATGTGVLEAAQGAGAHMGACSGDRYCSPTLRRAWLRVRPKPPCAFKVSMFIVFCNSH